MTRATKSENTFAEAEELARQHRMVLSNPSWGCYQLRHLDQGWIINIYPRRKGFSPRMYHDPHHPGPYLKLPDEWTILDAVRAASVAVTKEQ